MITVQELTDALHDAMRRGLSPDTAVVVATDEWFRVIDKLDHPADQTSGADMWFTLTPGDDADCRFTPGGEPIPLPPPLPNTRRVMPMGDGWWYTHCDGQFGYWCWTQHLSKALNDAGYWVGQERAARSTR